jgi:hypothetical protein
MKYKSFRTQFIECKESGTLFRENCSHGHELLMCKRHGGQCMSSKCKDERVKENEEGTSCINMEEAVQIIL